MLLCLVFKLFLTLFNSAMFSLIEIRKKKRLYFHFETQIDEEPMERTGEFSMDYSEEKSLHFQVNFES